MATLTLHDVPEDLMTRLEERADAHGRSLNSEVLAALETLEPAIAPPKVEAAAMGQSATDPRPVEPAAAVSEEALTKIRATLARFPGSAKAAQQPRDPEEVREELELFARLRSQFKGPPLTSEEIIAAIEREPSAGTGSLWFPHQSGVLMLVADTNVLIELFLPSENSAEVQQWRAADKDWQLPALWVFEFCHILLKYLRAERLDLDEAIANLVEAERLFLPRTRTVSSADSLQLAHRHGCSSYDAEFVLLAKQLDCLLLTFDRKLLKLFPEVAVKPGS